MAGGKADTAQEAKERLRKVIADGSALKKLAEFVEAQGGNADAVYNMGLLPAARIVRPIPAPVSGYINHITCDEVGICSLILGGGRETKESAIDLSVGLVLCKKSGDYVEAGEPLAMLHANDETRAEEAANRYLKACSIADTPRERTDFIRGILE